MRNRLFLKNKQHLFDCFEFSPKKINHLKEILKELMRLDKKPTMSKLICRIWNSPLSDKDVAFLLIEILPLMESVDMVERVK